MQYRKLFSGHDIWDIEFYLALLSSHASAAALDLVWLVLHEKCSKFADRKMIWINPTAAYIEETHI